MTWQAVSIWPYVGALASPTSVVKSPKQHGPFGSNQQEETSDEVGESGRKDGRRLSEELGGLNGRSLYSLT
jgi:hypothetical protein